MSTFHLQRETISYPARGIYYPTPEGLRLARVESFSKPIFVPDGWEDCAPTRPPKGEAEGAQEEIDEVDQLIKARDNVERAVRRAKTRAFDLIMCNPDMDLFATLTYSPEFTEDKSSYSECYRYLNSFLSNRVQRRGLKYVCAPERTKKGDIHFHMICTANAFDLTTAHSPYDGRILMHKGKILYNLKDWTRGFSSAEYITDINFDGSARDRVAKYIFKYIGKDINSKVGGRYLLTGGAFVKPVVIHGDRKEEFSTGLSTPRFEKRVEISSRDLRYECDYYI